MSSGSEPLKLAVIAGEPSGDLLGADLISALAARQNGRAIELIGVGGDAMAAQGLRSLFDYHDLSIVGVSAIVAQLPKLMSHVRKTTKAIIDARPDILIIIDSPAFTHRVAKKVRKELPHLPVVNYVCPTVWAWRPHRAREMTGYVDHILSILPFEKEIVSTLAGPPLTYVGHRLGSDASMREAAAYQLERRAGNKTDGKPLLKNPFVLCSRDLAMGRSNAYCRISATRRISSRRECPGFSFTFPPCHGWKHLFEPKQTNGQFR